MDKAVVGDLVALQAAQPKVAMMPHPAGDVDAWIKLAVDDKSSWKQLVKPVLTHIGSPALGPAETVQCPDCHKSFLVKGLGAHRARVHNVQNGGGPLRHLSSMRALLLHTPKGDTPH